MHSTALFTVLAIGASAAAAGDTVFLTAKTTQIRTVTHCADSYTDCPLSKTTAAATTPAAASPPASSQPASDTSVGSVETSVASQLPSTTSFPTAHTTTSGAPTGITPASSTTDPVLMPTGAAGGLRAQNGAAAVAVAAVIAMVY
ncbi:hypothetical protein E4U21_006977 [Claviceps maximensis]|nr:hypothetical protein E4U21_006977 [Claviceps maximensis]